MYRVWGESNGGGDRTYVDDIPPGTPEAGINTRFAFTLRSSAMATASIYECLVLGSMISLSTAPSLCMHAFRRCHLGLSVCCCVVALYCHRGFLLVGKGDGVG